MSFIFDRQYLNWYKDMAVKEPNYFPFKNNLECYLEWMEGLVLCDCGAGCRDTFAENGAKLACLLRLATDSSLTDLNDLVLKDPKEFLRELHREQFEKAKTRASKT